MNIDNYPITEKQINKWNKDLRKINVFPMELLSIRIIKIIIIFRKFL